MGRESLKRAWTAGLGPDNLDVDLTIDIDSTIRQAYGTQKQGCAFGYTKVRGYHPLLASLSQTGEALHVRLRGGNAGSARGAASFITETIARVREAGATGQLTIRMDTSVGQQGGDRRMPQSRRALFDHRADKQIDPQSDRRNTR